MSYKQQVKGHSRSALWKHAVCSLTSQRESSRILTRSYLERVWNYAWDDVLVKVRDLEPHKADVARYFQSWLDYSDATYGTRSPSDLRVAYFSGPEPENDLSELLNLGVRIENVWAFESDQRTYQQALATARKRFPFLKIFPGSIADFFRTNHLTFDIVYLDFTASLVSKSLSTLGPLHAIFDEQALSDQSVLIVNTCEPDPTDDVCDFLASYFYFQPMVECTAYAKEPHREPDGDIAWFSESATAHGYDLDDLSKIASANLTQVYSAFATSYPLYYSSFLSPTLRFLRNSALRRQLFTGDKTAHTEAFDRMNDVSVLAEFLRPSEEQKEEACVPAQRISGDRIFSPDTFSFWNFVDALKLHAGDLGTYWHAEYSRTRDGASVLDAAKFRESLRETLAGYDGLLSANIKDQIRRVNAVIPDARGGLFCDVPMAHLWLELALNQLGAPYHASVRNHRRWTYKAKSRRMHVDVFTFDRCRSLYDFLPMVDMYGEVLSNLLPQMIARCCIDAIGKEARWPLANLYYGSNVVCINDIEGADFAEMYARVELDA